MAKRKKSAFILRNSMGQVEFGDDDINIVFGLLRRYDQPAGIYSIEGPDTNCTVEKRGEWFYVTSGTLQGEQIKPRSLAEAEEFFAEARERLARERAERRQKNFAVIGFTDMVYPVDLRTHPEEKIRAARPPKFRRKFFTWEEARIFAIVFNERVLERPCPQKAQEQSWENWLGTVREMLLAIENADSPDDEYLAERIEEDGLF